jgi:hypothetical protein
MEKMYSHRSVTRKKPHPYIKPPKSWIEKYNQLTTPPESFYEDITLLHNFTTRKCTTAERNNWMDVLIRFEIGTQERFIWALLFLKSTNGVADKVSCRHFQRVIESEGALPFDIYKDPYCIASILRQTSKWVKNTVSFLLNYLLCVNIL